MKGSKLTGIFSIVSGVGIFVVSTLTYTEIAPKLAKMYTDFNISNPYENPLTSIIYFSLIALVSATNIFIGTKVLKSKGVFKNSMHGVIFAILSILFSLIGMAIFFLSTSSEALYRMTL